jgi:chromosome segregation ATPase
MYPKSGFQTFGSAPEPDLSSAATRLQTASLVEQTTSPTKMAAPSVPSRAKPNIPQKKNHIDELFRLRRDLEDAINARDDAVEMKDMMAEDLLTAQEEVQERDDEVKRWREKAEKFQNQVKELRTRQTLRAGGASSPSLGGANNAKLEAENRQLRQQVDQLTVELAQKDTQLVNASVSTNMESMLRNQLAEEQKLREAAEADLKNTQDHYELRLKEAERLANTQIEAEKQRAQATENALNEQMNRMDIDSTSQQQNQQQIATYEAEIRDQRQRCNQFKKTSERLTTQVKQAVDAKRDLERSDQEMRHTIEDLKSEIAALQLQIRDNRMPSSFSEGGPQYRFS